MVIYLIGIAAETESIEIAGENMNFIESRNLSFEYDDNRKKAVDSVDICVETGEFVAVLGHNGSGKSTLAKLINALLIPTDGCIFVGGFDTKDEKNIWKVRQSAGMVFQNPDNQIIATVVEEDVAFGPENLGIEPHEIKKRVCYALEAVKMKGFEKKAPHLLSGGQKQRVAVAGILAMKPKCIILDEPTAMLDPCGRKDVLDIIVSLNKTENITVVLITHFMEEAVLADRIFVMENGSVALCGTPKQVFKNVERIKNLKLDVPAVTEIAYRLRMAGIDISDDIMSVDEMAEEIAKKKVNVKRLSLNLNPKKSDEKFQKIVEVKNLSYVYGKNSVFEKTAVDNVSFDVYKGEIVAIIGHTGSGKSTLIQNLNALMKPDKGNIFIDGKDIFESKEKLNLIRQKVGLVFQYPENQLFEESVFKDVKFGPLNMGLSEEEADKRVREALSIVGIDEEFYEKSPFELSGGQKRRIAIAGVLAMKPEILILDEPTAGLDPCGRDELLKNIIFMHDKLDMTVIIVSHSMEEVASFADRIIVMNNGRVELDGDCEHVFSKTEVLKNTGILPPQVTQLFDKINEKGMTVPKNIYTIESAVEFLTERLG